MPVTLTLFRADGSGPPRDRRTLAAGAVNIGRGGNSDWVLPDPDQHLSKLHCSVALAGGRWRLTDLSTNGVYVNGARERMPRDAAVILTDGDSFRLGDYLVRVAETEDRGVPASGPEPFEDPFAEPPAGGGFVHPLAPRHLPAPRGPDPFDEFDAARPASAAIERFEGAAPVHAWAGPAQRDDAAAPSQVMSPLRLAAALSDSDLDALLGDTPPEPTGAGARPGGSRPAPAALPDDFDLDDLLSSEAAARPPAPPASAPLADPFAEEPPFVAQPAVTASLPAGPPAQVNAQPTLPANPASPQAAPATSHAAIDAAHPVPATPPAQLASAPAAQTPVPAAIAPDQPPVAAADAARLLAAFCAGAGIAPPATALRDPEAYLRDNGALLRLMVERLRDVLMSRMEVKRGFGVEQTMLRPRDNNVLKFSVTSADAVAAMLEPGRAGYLPPARAAEEAFADLRSHQLAVMAGVQAALLGLLKRLDPAALEARLGAASGLAALLPAARKAQMWEAFRGTWRDIATEAEADFQTVFGREFARAYTEQEKKV